MSEQVPERVRKIFSERDCPPGWTGLRASDSGRRPSGTMPGGKTTCLAVNFKSKLNRKLLECHLNIFVTENITHANTG